MLPMQVRFRLIPRQPPALSFRTEVIEIEVNIGPSFDPIGAFKLKQHLSDYLMVVYSVWPLRGRTP